MKKMLVLMLSLLAMNAYATVIDCDKKYPEDKELCNIEASKLPPLPPPPAIPLPNIYKEATQSYKIELAFMENGKDIKRETFTVTQDQPLRYSNIKKAEYLSFLQKVQTPHGEKEERTYNDLISQEHITIYVRENKKDKNKIEVKVILNVQEVSKMNAHSTQNETITLPEMVNVNLEQSAILNLGEEKEIYKSEGEDDEGILLTKNQSKIYQLRIKATKL